MIYYIMSKEEQEFEHQEVSNFLQSSKEFITIEEYKSLLVIVV
jgi:hypothetical protein